MPNDVAEAPLKAETFAIDRRRPDRPTDVSPELVRLLRWRPTLGQHAFDALDCDQLGQQPDWDDPSQRTAEGLMLGVLSGGAIWAGLILTVRALLG